MDLEISRNADLERDLDLEEMQNQLNATQKQYEIKQKRAEAHQAASEEEEMSLKLEELEQRRQEMIERIKSLQKETKEVATSHNNKIRKMQQKLDKKVKRSNSISSLFGLRKDANAS